MPQVIRAAPHRSANELSLDISERQVLIYYAGDALPWHSRLLLYHLADGKWVVVTPTGDIQIQDL